MSRPSSAFPPVFLLELLDGPNGLTDEADNFSKLELAIERALSHLRELRVDFTAEVSFDEDGELEGISFIDVDASGVVAFITAYHLDRETGAAANPALSAACAGDLSNLQAFLSQELSGN